MAQVASVFAVFLFLLIVAVKATIINTTMEERSGDYTCTKSADSVSQWAYEVADNIQRDCTANYADRKTRWSMLNAFRVGGQTKYTTDENDKDCLKDWTYYAIDGVTVIANIKGRLTSLNDNRSWCPLKIYHPGGQRGYQWEYCTCTDLPPPPAPVVRVVPTPATTQPCTKPAGSLMFWYYDKKKNGPYYCVNQWEDTGKNWTMLNAYRSGGDKKVHWKYTTDENDPECLVNWVYFEKHGYKKIATISRTTRLGDKYNKRWCALPVYRPGGKQGYQWEFCKCA